MKRLVLPLLAVVLTAASCQYVQSFLHDGEVVARVGKHKLYAADLEQMIPGDLEKEDSTRLALQYINNWATDMLFMDMAGDELTKAEKDVSREIESYRSSLLKYRYEQKYINQRLDTAVTAGEVDRYYESHTDQFKLTRPIVKARFARLSPDSPNLAAIRKNFAAQKDDDLVVSDSLTLASALRYTDFGKRWIDIAILAREFEVDYLSLAAAIRNGTVEMKDSKGNVCIASISGMFNTGETGPVEYYEDQIRDIILSTRKQVLLNALERELIEKARTDENFVIY